MNHRYIISKNNDIAPFQPYQVYHSYERTVVARFKFKKDAIEFCKKLNPKQSA